MSKDFEMPLLTFTASVQDVLSQMGVHHAFVTIAGGPSVLDSDGNQQMVLRVTETSLVADNLTYQVNLCDTVSPKGDFLPRKARDALTMARAKRLQER